MEANKVLPKEAIDEFIKLYEARFNKKLSQGEAARRANNLYFLYEAVYRNSK